MKRILLLAALVLGAITMTLAQDGSQGTSRDFWRSPIRVQAKNITPVPTDTNMVLVSQMQSNGTIRYEGMPASELFLVEGGGGLISALPVEDVTITADTTDLTILTLDTVSLQMNELILSISGGYRISSTTFDVNANGTVEMNDYGLGNDDATSLGKTQSVYMAGFATDGTIIEVTYRSGSGAPSGVVTPAFLGQEYFDTGGAHWYKATGLTNTDWKQITN